MRKTRHRASFAIGVLLIALAGAVPASQSAGNSAEVAFHAFQDTRGVTVLSPDLSVFRNMSDRTALSMRFGLDAISSPSEACINCHPKGPTNRRLVGNLNVTRRYGDTTISAGGELSQEYFYSSSALMASVSRGLNKGNTAVTAGVSYARNLPELHPSEESRTQISLGAYGSVTQSWTRTTVTQVGYELNHVGGYQANPFLRTEINGFELHDRVPRERRRHALWARLRQALPTQMTLEAEYRRYLDSWSIESDTVNLGLSRHFGPRVVAGGNYRFYAQSGAFFYSPIYSEIPVYLTTDYRLFPFDSDTFSGRLAITPRGMGGLLPDNSTFRFDYEHYVSSSGFHANVFTAGLQIPMK